MIKLNFKDKLKDSLLLIATTLSLLLALIGLCVGSVKQTVDLSSIGGMGTASEVASFGDLSSGNATSRAGLAFAIIGFILLVAVGVLMVLELMGKYPKITRFKMYVSAAALVCIIISFACVCAFSRDLSNTLSIIGGKASVAAGCVIYFVFGIIASIAAVFFNRPIKFWQQPIEE